MHVVWLVFGWGSWVADVDVVMKILLTDFREDVDEHIDGVEKVFKVSVGAVGGGIAHSIGHCEHFFEQFSDGCLFFYDLLSFFFGATEGGQAVNPATDAAARDVESVYAWFGVGKLSEFGFCVDEGLLDIAN